MIALLCARFRQCAATSLDELVARLDADVAGGEPLVAHVVVALCDNEFQGIVPVPADTG